MTHIHTTSLVVAGFASILVIAALIATSCRSPQSAQSSDGYFKLSPAQAITNAVPLLAQPLPLFDVRLTSGPLKHAQGDGYIGALKGTERVDGTNRLVDGKELFEQLAHGRIRSGGFDLNGMWSPWYVQHKIFAGLRDAYRLTGNRTALDVEIKFAGWAGSIVTNLTEAQDQRLYNCARTFFKEWRYLPLFRVSSHPSPAWGGVLMCLPSFVYRRFVGVCALLCIPHFGRFLPPWA